MYFSNDGSLFKFSGLLKYYNGIYKIFPERMTIKGCYVNFPNIKQNTYFA